MSQGMLQNARLYGWFLVSFVIVIMDQLSKYYISHHYFMYDSIPIFSLLNITLAHNTGAAFSFLSQAGQWHEWFFTGFTCIMSLALVFWMLSLKATEKMHLGALSFILGGAVGNLVDRFRLGYVIDFIDVHYQNHHFAIFNLADAAITIGTIALAYLLMGKQSG